jgi:recombinational DNA repair protein (RecF pathway)
LAADEQPDPALQRELKQMMRTLLRHHLGGRDLNAWRSFRS